MKNHADVIIIGGGIIGCAAAYYIRKKGYSVIVLEGSPHSATADPAETAAVCVSPDVIQGKLPLAMYAIKLCGLHYPMNWK